MDLEMKRRPMYHGSVETHKMLLAQTRDLMRCMSQDSRIMDCATPVLFHPDLHKRNIFVLEDDPSEITAIIDWQAASIEPAFCYADEIPDFATENEVCTRAFCTHALKAEIDGPKSIPTISLQLQDVEGWSCGTTPRLD